MSARLYVYTPRYTLSIIYAHQQTTCVHTGKDFQELVMFLQKPPTEGWKVEDVECLLSQGYVYQSLFHNAPNHLK